MKILPAKVSNTVFLDITIWLLENRPPEKIRHQIDIIWRVEGQSVYISEKRPHWSNPALNMTNDFAKATYIKSSDQWKIFWLKSDLKWHTYKPLPGVRYFAEFLEEVAKDPYGCFKG